MGMAVPLNCWPMAKPASEPKMVEMKPWAEEAVPAIWPIGSMAIEPKLPAMKPKQNMVRPCRTAKVQIVSWPAQRHGRMDRRRW